MPFGEASFWVFLTMFGTGLSLYFIKERRDRIAAFCLVIIGVIGMGVTVYQHAYPSTKLASPNFLAWLGLGITWVFLVYVISIARANSRRATTDAIQFFRNRIALDGARSIISEELQKHGETFWVMWQAGHLMAHIAPEVRKKIHRMILCNPKASKETLDYLARAADAGTGDNVRSRIADATRLALAAGTHVKYSNEQSISLVIANPNNTNKSGWVRIEYILPFMPPTRRPSIVITETQFPDVFEVFVGAYAAMWDEAIPAD